MARKDITDKQVCEAYEQYGKNVSNGIRPLAWLIFKTGEPEKVCWRAMERACDRGLVEYGVSLNVGWLTERGKEMLR